MAKEPVGNGARGEGAIERPLDEASKGGPGERSETKGKEITKLEWEIQIFVDLF
jgi:hypothetical protein